jgi:Polyketide cyclase / dehydrase and lipid transport
MAANEYHFVTYWRVEGAIEEVSDVLDKACDLPRWWPSVYLSVQQREPGGPVELVTKGWLPYRLHWFFRVTEAHRPQGFSIEAWGDLEGRGTWTLEQDGRCVNVTYDWHVRAEKPLLRYLSFVFKPLFRANHRWAMARGEESLKAELGRRAGAGQQSARQTS